MQVRIFEDFVAETRCKRCNRLYQTEDMLEIILIKNLTKSMANRYLSGCYCPKCTKMQIVDEINKHNYHEIKMKVCRVEPVMMDVAALLERE